MNKNQNKIDAKLVLDIQSGNKIAFVQLVKRWHKVFCEKSFWIVKNADVSKDIAQDTWNVIMVKIYDINDPNSFKSWALRIVYNKSLDWIKTNNKARILSENYKYEQAILTEESILDIDERKQKVLKAVDDLPTHHEEIIRLFYINDYSLKEIASTLNISVGTAKSRLFHAREKLKKTLT